MGEVDLSKSWDHERNCTYCGRKFQPKRPQDRDQLFCKPNCRKNYFRYGARDSVRAAVRVDLQREIDGLKRRMSEMERQLQRILRKPEKFLDNQAENVATLQQETREQ